MAQDFERLVVALSADLRSYENAMKKAVGVTNARAREIEQRYRRMNASISNAVTAPLAGLGAALSVREITRYADAWTQARNIIAAAAQSSGVQARSLEELKVGADSARQSLETYAGLYANLIRSASGVAKSEEEIALATNLVAKAMKAGGAGVQEQQAAIQQLGQALSSGVLQGDELRSLRENAPVLADAIAKEFQVTIGELKKLGEDGKLTSDRVFRAIINAQAGIEAQFGKTNQTIADGLTKLGNAVTEFVGRLFETTGATSAINTMLGAIAGSIDGIAAAAAAAGALILSSYVPALTRMAAAGAVAIATNPFLAIAAAIGTAAFALTSFGDDFTVIQGDMATFGDYARTIWGGISEGVTTAATALSDAFLGALSYISEAMGGIPVTWAQVGEAIAGLINGQIGIIVGFADAAVAAFKGIGSAVAEGIAGAVDAVITMVERMANAVIGGVNDTIGALNSFSGITGKTFATLGTVTLPRVTGELAGSIQNMEAAVSDAFNKAINRDYVGEALQGIRKQANITALDRRMQERDARDSERPISNAGYGSGLGAPSAAGGGGGGKGKKGAKPKQDELEKEIAQIQKRTAALQAETAAQAGINPLVEDYGYAVEKARAYQELETAAKEAGIPVTDALKTKMLELSDAYAQAVVASAQLGESQDEIRQRAEDMRDATRDASQGIVQDLLAGKSAADAFAGALGKIGDRLLNMAFDQAFGKGGIFGGVGSGGGFLNALSSLFGGFRAGGGPVQAGRAYVVGEKRPELFVPGQSGHIVPSIPKAVMSPRGATGLDIGLAVDVDESGNLMPFVTRVSQREISANRPKAMRESTAAVGRLNRKTGRFLG